MKRIFKCLLQLPILLVVAWVALNVIGVAIWQDFTYSWMKRLVTDLYNNIAEMSFMACLFELVPITITVLLYACRKEIAEEWRKECTIFNKLIHGQTCDQ